MHACMDGCMYVCTVLNIYLHVCVYAQARASVRRHSLIKRILGQ